MEQEKKTVATIVFPFFSTTKALQVEVEDVFDV